MIRMDVSSMDVLLLLRKNSRASEKLPYSLLESPFSITSVGENNLKGKVKPKSYYHPGFPSDEIRLGYANLRISCLFVLPAVNVIADREPLKGNSTRTSHGFQQHVGSKLYLTVD